MSRVSWNLKEALGKTLRRRTGIGYEADKVGKVPLHTKAQYCTEPTSVDPTAIRGKVVVLIRGGLNGGATCSNNERREVSRGHSSRKL